MPETTPYADESPAAFRRRMRKKAKGLDTRQLRKRAKSAPDHKAKLFARALDNRKLAKANPDWRKRAGGGGRMFKSLRQLRSKDKLTGVDAQRLPKLEAKADAFTDKRSLMLERLRKRKQDIPSLPPRGGTPKGRSEKRRNAPKTRRGY